jgi:hypothetical protein
MSMTRALRLLALLSLMFGALSCVRSSKPTEVAQGLYFSAGSPDYDEFFVRVHRLQVELAGAPSELAEARRVLADAVVSAPDAPNAQLAEKVKLALDRLVEHGVRTRIEFRAPSPADPPHTMAILTYSATPAGNERQTVEHIEAAMTRVLRFAATMRAAGTRAGELRASVARLESGVETVFREQSRGRRAQIHDNLRDAERVSVLMLARSDELSRPAEELANELSRVLSSYFKPWPVAPPPEPAPAPEPPRPKPRATPDARPRTSEPKAKASSEAPKSADFEP